MLKLLSSEPRLPATSESGTRATDERWWIVGLLFLGMLINYIDRGNLSIAAVPIMRELHLSTSMAGVTLSAFFWTYLIFQIPAGYFVDRAGLRLSYGISFLVWTLSSAAVGLVHSVSGLISLRLMLGMGESVAAPASLAYIKRNFHGEEQGLPNAFYLSGMTLGPAVGVFLGGVLLEQVGWRTLFVLTGLVSMFWLWPWARLAPSSGGVAIETGIPSATPESQPSQAWRRLLRNPVVWGVAASSLLYGYYSFFCFTWLPSYLVMSRGYTYTKTGTFMALPLTACALSCIVFGRLADRLARNPFSFGRAEGVRHCWIFASHLNPSRDRREILRPSPGSFALFLYGLRSRYCEFLGHHSDYLPRPSDWQIRGLSECGRGSWWCVRPDCDGATVG